MLRRRIPSPCVRNHKITRPRCFVCSYCLVCQTVGNQTSTGAAVKNKVAFRNPNSLHCAPRSPAQPKQNFRQLSQTSRRARIGTFASTRPFCWCYLSLGNVFAFHTFVWSSIAHRSESSSRPKATWSKSFEGAKLKSVCGESLADCRSWK